MSHKILTVDDSKTVRVIVHKAFKQYECEIFEAGNGVEGLALAAKELPDLILLDVTMPVMDGVEMLAKLKADPALKNIRVMMLTAEGSRENVMKIAKLGIRDYLVKPFKEKSLLEKALKILELKRKPGATPEALSPRPMALKIPLRTGSPSRPPAGLPEPLGLKPDLPPAPGVPTDPVPSGV